MQHWSNPGKAYEDSELLRVLPDSQSIRLADHESAQLRHVCTCDQPGGEGLVARQLDSKQDTAGMLE